MPNAVSTTAKYSSPTATTNTSRGIIGRTTANVRFRAFGQSDPLGAGHDGEGALRGVAWCRSRSHDRTPEGAGGHGGPESAVPQLRSGPVRGPGGRRLRGKWPDRRGLRL